MNKSLLILTFCLLFFACEEDDYTEVELSDRVVSSFNGMIVDEEGQPLEGVRVTLESEFAVTGSSGTFVLANVDVPRSSAFLKANKEGFFSGSRTIHPIPNKQNKVRIMLLEKDVAGILASAVGGEVSLEDGTKVSLPPDAIVKADGSAYNGNVKVHLKRLNPVDGEMGAQMPGNLIGIDGAGDEVVLESYGMIAVELQSEDGEILEIKAGMNADIRIPVNEILGENAPPTIPLWFFNESTGLWQEEGSAQFDGEYYVGSVSHFSFWNCDAGFPIVHLSGSILIDGMPVENQIVRIKRLAAPIYNNTGIAWTNNIGGFSGGVPLNELLELSVLDQCLDIIYSVVIGPFTTDHILEPIEIDPTNVETFTITGIALSCEGNPITSGFVTVKFGNLEIEHLITGTEFEFLFIDCGNATDFEIRVVDALEATGSGWLTFGVGGSGRIDIGTVLTCEQLSEYITISIADTQYLLIHDVAAGYGYAPGFEQFGLNTFAQARLFDFVDSQTIWISLLVPDDNGIAEPGTYHEAGNIIWIPDISVLESFETGAVDSIVFNTIGEVGELIDGEYYGILQNVDSTWQYDLNYSGHFHLMRTH